MQPQRSFHMISPEPKSTDRRSVIRVHCSKCPQTLTLHMHKFRALPPEAMTRMIARKGWGVGRNRDQDTCPTCLGHNKKTDIINKGKDLVMSTGKNSVEASKMPDDIDLEIFKRLDQHDSKIDEIRNSLRDGSTAMELTLESNAKIYEMMKGTLREMREMHSSMRLMAEIMATDYDGEIPSPVVEHDPEEPYNLKNLIPYGEKGFGRRLTPVEKITITNWDGTGIKIRFSREVWDEAGMPIHEGARIVVQPHEDMMLVRVAREGEKGIGLWRVNAQSVHIQTKSFTSEKSDFHPQIENISPGSILVNVV